MNSARWHQVSAHTFSPMSQGSSQSHLFCSLTANFQCWQPHRACPFRENELYLLPFHELQVELSTSSGPRNVSGTQWWHIIRMSNSFSGCRLDCLCQSKTQQCSQDQTFSRIKCEVCIYQQFIEFFPAYSHLCFILNCKAAGT